MKFLIGAKKKRGLLLIFFVFIAVVFYFLFFMNTEKTPEHLIGTWIRTDGPYTIEITKFEKDGVSVQVGITEDDDNSLITLTVGEQ